MAKVFEVREWVESKHGGASMSQGGKYVIVRSGEEEPPDYELESQCDPDSEQCQEGQCSCGHFGIRSSLIGEFHDSLTNRQIWQKVYQRVQDSDIPKTLERYEQPKYVRLPG